MKHILYFVPLAVLLAAGPGCSKGEQAESAGGSVAMKGEGVAPAGASAEGSSFGAKLTSNDARTRNAAQVAPKEVPNRAVIRNGSLSVRVENVEKAEDKVVGLVQSLGGYVDSTDSTDLATATPSLHMKIRVPSTRFDQVLDQFERLGTRLSKKISTEDVTASLVDMAARLKIMQAQEEVLRRILAGSHNTNEMMDVQEKLMNLRGTIESLEAQHKTLSQLAALSSIELTLQQSAEGAVAATNDPNWAKEAWGSATSVLGGTARVVGTGVIWILVFAPLWIPVAWLARQAAKCKRQAAKSPQFDVSI